MTRISRTPIRVTVDADLRERLVGTALRAVLRPGPLLRGWIGWFVIGALVWLVTGRLWVGLLVAPGFPLVMALRAVVLSRRRVRAAAAIGTVLTSSYDARGRLVITRATGDLVLQPGSARSVERGGDVTVVRWRGRLGPLVTPSALLTDDDVEWLTTDPPTEQLPYSVVVTRQVRRNTFLGVLAAIGRHPAGVTVIVLVVLSTWFVVLFPSPDGWVLLAFDAALLVSFAGVIWLSQRRTFRLGAEVRAGVDEEGLRLDIPYYPALVPRPTIRRIVRNGRCIVLTRRNGRVMVLPRELLQPAAMRDLTGLPAQESDAL